MPRISEFFGIIISMYYNEHAPPHFHAIYGEFKVSILIENLGILEGRLPPKALSLVIEWADLHQEELRKNWDLLKEHKPLFKIEPLK